VSVPDTWVTVYSGDMGNTLVVCNPCARKRALAGADMKRGFLFGFASSLCLAVLLGLMQLSNDVTTAAIVMATSVPLSILVIRAACRAPPNRSRAHTVIGWLVGFLIIDAVLLCMFGIIVIFSNLS
jgi:hypothetical protein